MFIHVFIKQLKIGLGNRSNIFWTLMFPVILSTLFYVAFGSVFSEFSADPIKTAVVYETEKNELKDNAEAYLKTLRMSDHAMFDIVNTDSETAKELLEDEGKVNGIITVKDNGRMELAIASNGVLSTIQANITSVYNQNLDLIEKVSKENPEKLEEVLLSIGNRAEFVSSCGMAGDNKDPFISYFYNLIAMAALFASFNSVRIGNNCQANMSSIGARTNAAPVKRSLIQAAGLLASFIVQTVIVLLGMAYMLWGLKMDFGGSIPMIFVTCVLASMLGVALGFFVGNLFKCEVDKKENILTWITLLGCALSGLMYGEMKGIITEKAPIINKINPAAVISDAFYSLNIFGIGERYITTVLYMVLFSVVLTAGGFILGRRNHYDSI